MHEDAAATCSHDPGGRDRTALTDPAIPTRGKSKGPVPQALMQEFAGAPYQCPQRRRHMVEYTATWPSNTMAG